MRRLFVLLLLGACSDDSVAPIATVEAATPEALMSADDAADDLTITIRYDDGDGDLGGGTAEVHDCRADALLTTLDIPAIAAQSVIDAKTRITGALELHVNDVGAAEAAALPSACSELGITTLGAGEAVFCVVLVDAAGHRGDGDCTGAIAIE